jgi:hypothetical protein
MAKTVSLMLGLVLIVMVYTVSPLGTDDQAEVENVIRSSYFNGAFNGLDTESMRRGFHPDFAIFSAKGTELARFPIDTWIKHIEQAKKSPDFDPDSSKMDCEIVSLDVTGGCASAKIEISKDGRQVFTDYLLLLKFEDGWKIAAKVYHRYE